MTYAELDSKLAELEKVQKTAERELQTLKERTERLEQLEKDKDALLEYYAALAPEPLDTLSPEEHHRLYKMLRLSVVVHTDGPLEISGLLGEPMCTSSPTSSSRLPSLSIWSSPRFTRTTPPAPYHVSPTWV
jgi:hypothetical protein